jgi:hypothetical protein
MWPEETRTKNELAGGRKGRRFLIHPPALKRDDVCFDAENINPGWFLEDES